MPKCDKCNKEIPYKVVFSSIWNFSGYKKIRCIDCNVLLKITNLSRIMISILMALPLLILFQINITNSLTGVILFFILYAVMLIYISSLIVRYKLDKGSKAI